MGGQGDTEILDIAASWDPAKNELKLAMCSLDGNTYYYPWMSSSIDSIIAYLDPCNTKTLVSSFVGGINWPSGHEDANGFFVVARFLFFVFVFLHGIIRL